MKKSVVGIIVLVVVVVGVAAYALMHNNNNNGYGYSSSSQNNSSMSQQSSSQTNTQTTNKVTISNFSFTPASITVKKGTTVTWTNQDSVAHTVVETDGQTGPHSQDLANGASYSFTYSTTGTFQYHCSVHPEMTGRVVVTE